VWVEVEAATVEVDGSLEVLRVAETAGGFLDHWMTALTPSRPALVMRWRR
jgi:hypothetical protein